MASDRLRRYAEGGGTLIATGAALSWVDNRKVATLSFRKSESTKTNRRPYAQAEDDAAIALISGAIFKTHVDTTHPVCYGLPPGEPLPVFRKGRVVLEPSSNPYATPVIYDSRPLWSGYTSEENQKLLAESAGVVIVPVGKGRLIAFADGPNFRSVWRGTERLFVNAVFFGPVLR